jgi:hypothetical protein
MKEREIPKAKTLYEIYKPPPTWQERDQERIAALDVMIALSVNRFPSSVPLKDMAYLMEVIKAAEGEIDRLRDLCHGAGIVTSPPPFATPLGR